MGEGIRVMGEENKICFLLMSDQSAGNRWTSQKNNDANPYGMPVR